MTVLEEHKLLHPSQYGARRGMSTTQALTVLVNIIEQAKDKGIPLYGIDLDISATGVLNRTVISFLDY
eukprot:CAMPEP_0184344886 /NCGR_PEP_ID=MMETSP1089-20130417/13350_1 /TAXON_ID=38269 ORGANISM="Gloeochaete wittrockiana, Strain SAG46.84" /NCGR_SAMPLE_ID=MMETSP1089 /ASSEMBLY_ACC=CAM_ASM_000445 /LENGTH=67 /DNA_ID=CAMNT_0026674943 /DNA_START=248 /DNA_END=451 /DNA_ORIENTATION=-